MLEKIKEIFVKIRNKKILAFASIVIILLSGIIFAVYALNSTETEVAPQSEPSMPVSSSEVVSVVVESEPESIPEPEEFEVDFEELQEQNPDIYAYIEIPNTDISFPLLQHPTDNAYYLRRDLDQNDSIYGVIYTELYNSKEFTDINTVIYGHDTNDGQMFGALRAYYDEDYLVKNNEIIIHTPTDELTYNIFAALPYDDRHIAYTYDVTNLEKNAEYIESLKLNVNRENATFLEEFELTQESNIITLSTCYGDITNERYLVLAVLQE